MRQIISLISTVLLAIGYCGTLQAESAPRSALAALAMQLPEVKFDGTRLEDAIDSLRDVSNANFHVDWRQIEVIGVSRDTPVTFSARRITLRKALSTILSQTSNPGELSFYNDGGVIEITTKAIADDTVITRLYDVTDLLIPTMSMNGTGGNGSGFGNSGSGINSGMSSSGGGSRGRSSGNYSGGGAGGASSGSGRSLSSGGGGGLGGGSSGRSGVGSRSSGTSGTNGSGNNSNTSALADDLIAIIIDTIEPNVWQVNGGTSTIRYFQGNLIITAPRRIHERIGGYFE